MASSVKETEKVPKYVQLADQLREQILSGELPPHSPLLSQSEMKQRFGATQWTVEKVHAILEGDGLIRREPRRGLFVNDPSTRVKSDLVALVDEEITRAFAYNREIQQGLRAQAEASGKSITLVDKPDTFKHWKSMDGYVLDKFGSMNDSDFGPHYPRNIPVVRLHFPEEGISCVMADDAAGIGMAVRHLHELGHRRIGYLLQKIEHPEAPPTNEIRHAAYRKVMEECGIVREPEWSNFYRDVYSDFRDAGYGVMRKWLQEGWRDLKLTALLAQNDYVAAGVIQALQEDGIRVPEDVSVVGFDGCYPQEFVTLTLTTVVVPLREIGEMAMRVLVQRISQPNRPIDIIRLPVEFRLGESTAVAPKT
jgi:GntR family transcriptional regulator of arabinose operon